MDKNPYDGKNDLFLHQALLGIVLAIVAFIFQPIKEIRIMGIVLYCLSCIVTEMLYRSYNVPQEAFDAGKVIIGCTGWVFSLYLIAGMAIWWAFAATWLSFFLGSLIFNVDVSIEIRKNNKEENKENKK